MLTYIFLYAFFAFCCFVGRDWRQEKAYIFCCIAFLIILVGTRLDTGCDFQAYYARFRSLSVDESFWQVIRREEPGFWVLSYFVKRLGLDYVWLNLLCALIFFYCVAKFVLRHPNPALLLATMFPILVVQLSMSGVRQALATAFLMLAILSFFDGSRWKVIWYMLVGSLFHQSLILFLPLALAVGKEFSVSRIVMALAILSPISLLISSDRIDVYSDRYVEQIYGAMESSGSIFRTGLIVLTAIAFEIYKDKIRSAFSVEYNLLRIFSLFSLALIPLSFLSTVMTHRLGFYILPVQLYTLAILPFVVFRDMKSINFGQVIPVGVYAAYILVWFSFSSHAQYCYVPYESYLF